MKTWGAVTLLIVVATYAGGVVAPLELQDDHRIIAPELAPHPGAVAMWIDSLRVDATEMGRFRPVSQIFDVMGPVVLGPNPAVWHALLLVIAAVVTLLLYLAGTTAWSSPIAGAVFALVTMLAPDPGPTTTWYRLGPKEGWWMLFVAGALLLMVVYAGRAELGAELGIFALVVLSAFSKEPSVLLVPAFLGVRVWLEARARKVTVAAAARSLRGVAIAYAGVFVAGLAGIVYVLHSAGAHSYGGKSLGMSAGAIARVLARDLLRAPALAIWFVPVLFVLVLYPRRVDLFGLLVVLAWVAPQYLIYATRGGMWDHYWIPCIVGIAAVNAAAIAVLEREPGSIAFKVTAVATVLWTVNAIRIDAIAVQNFVRRASVQQAAARVAASHADPTKLLVVVSNYAAEESERADAFVDFVRFDGGRYRGSLMLDSACVRNCVPSIGPKDVGTVAFLDHDRPLPPLGNWYPRGVMQLIRVAGVQRFFSLRHCAITRETFSFVVAVRGPEHR